MKEEEIKKVVRKGYAKIAQKGRSCCTAPSSCCGSLDVAKEASKQIGYSEKELEAVPEGANLGLGCGNPVALASLKEGEMVLDLGAGAGFDCFLAANQVGKRGKVIGVDMTPEMLDKARENARKGNYKNVEFRLGEIENLPVADNSVDVVISNCVINLSPDKKRVFQEAFRVLKPGGRLMVSDIVLVKELPDFIKRSVEAYIGCVAGASMKEEYLRAIKAARFQNVRIIDEASFPTECFANDPTVKGIVEDSKIPGKKLREVASSIRSIKVYGFKPDGKSKEITLLGKVEDIQIGPANPADLPAILGLLEQRGLPKDGLSDHLATALVAIKGKTVVGSAALELYGSSALLRSVAVKRALQGQGLGHRLVQAALEQARKYGVSHVYLLTQTAGTFFTRFGFRPIPRSEVAPAVQGSAEFTSACPASARAMVRELT